MNRTAFFASLSLASLTARASAAAGEPSAHALGPVLEANAWINGRARSGDLAGRVVLVDVFTFECINCTRVTPNLKALYRRYSRGQLAIVAVHTPEIPSYQRSLRYLAQQTHRAALPWPIAIDNDMRIWNAYGVDAWPTQLVFDRSGKLRGRIVGDSQDDALDRMIRDALRSTV